MKKDLLFIIFIFFIFNSCSQQTRENSQEHKNPDHERLYGGIFNINHPTYIHSLSPLHISEGDSDLVPSLIYEGLFNLDPETSEIRNSLAESYSLDTTNHLYTIRLKKGVYFHDDPCFAGGKGREMNAEDVIYCFNKLITSNAQDQTVRLFRESIKGGNENYRVILGDKNYYNTEGIKKVDNHTVQITLNKRNAFFLHYLCKPKFYIYPKEAEEMYGSEMNSKSVGTGPFQINSLLENVSLILKRNSNYHGSDSYGNQLPYLSAVHLNFIKDKNAAFSEFDNGNLDMLYKISSRDILKKHLKSSFEKKGYQTVKTPGNEIHFLSFNLSNPVFKNINFRKALSFAIDRKKMLHILGQGKEGIYGLFAPNGSLINDNVYYEFNLDSANYYLHQSGLYNMQIPPILLYTEEGEKNIAEEIQDQLKKHLNLDVEIILYNANTSLNFSSTTGMVKSKYYISHNYSDINNLLFHFYGKEVIKRRPSLYFPNNTVYINRYFDKIYEGMTSTNSLEYVKKQMLSAENVLMEDAPLITLWYSESTHLLKSYIKNAGSEKKLDFKYLYVLKPKKLD